MRIAASRSGPSVPATFARIPATFGAGMRGEVCKVSQKDQRSRVGLRQCGSGCSHATWPCPHLLSQASDPRSRTKTRLGVKGSRGTGTASSSSRSKAGATLERQELSLSNVRRWTWPLPPDVSRIPNVDWLRTSHHGRSSGESHRTLSFELRLAFTCVLVPNLAKLTTGLLCRNQISKQQPPSTDWRLLLLPD
jgi:hypothetical protein